MVYIIGSRKKPHCRKCIYMYIYFLQNSSCQWILVILWRRRCSWKYICYMVHWGYSLSDLSFVNVISTQSCVYVHRSNHSNPLLWCRCNRDISDPSSSIKDNNSFFPQKSCARFFQANANAVAVGDASQLRKCEHHSHLSKWTTLCNGNKLYSTLFACIYTLINLIFELRTNTLVAALTCLLLSFLLLSASAVKAQQ